MKHIIVVALLALTWPAIAQTALVTVGNAGAISGISAPMAGERETWAIAGGMYTTWALDLASSDTTFEASNCAYPQGRAERHVAPGTYVATRMASALCLTPQQWQARRRAEIGLSPL